MTIIEIAAQAAAQRGVGLRYQQGGRRPFRDRVTVYYDGKMLFERFCYGEAAGKVFTMWANGQAEDGTLAWDYDACPNSAKTQAPKCLTGADTAGLYFDGKAEAWGPAVLLKHDRENGYSALRGLLGRLFGKR